MQLLFYFNVCLAREKSGRESENERERERERETEREREREREKEKSHMCILSIL